MKIDPEIPSSIGELAVVLSQKFEAVLLEADPEMLSQLVADAEAAIFLRFQSLDNSPNGHAERDALGDAIRTLRAIQTGKLHCPDWNGN
jgi:hypothetical protein